MINFSTRRVGGLRFVKIGRLNISWSISRRPAGERSTLETLAIYGMALFLAIFLAPVAAHAADASYALMAYHAEPAGIGAYILDKGLTADDCNREIDNAGATVSLEPGNIVALHTVVLFCKPEARIIHGIEDNADFWIGNENDIEIDADRDQN
jgi:hypothetical protein